MGLGVCLSDIDRIVPPHCERAEVSLAVTGKNKPVWHHIIRMVS